MGIQQTRRAAAPRCHVVVMGVAGSGKSTIAGLLGGRLGHDVVEADAFHPAGNINKMMAGLPLTDADRAPWLGALRDRLLDGTVVGRPAVVACSALRRGYRDLLRGAGPVRFVHLTGSPDLLHDRIEGRSGHFMPPALLPSQLATLEPLGPDEDGLTVDTALEPDLVVELVVDWLSRTRAVVSRP